MTDQLEKITIENYYIIGQCGTDENESYMKGPYPTPEDMNSHSEGLEEGGYYPIKATPQQAGWLRSCIDNGASLKNMKKQIDEIGITILEPTELRPTG